MATTVDSVLGTLAAVEGVVRSTSRVFGALAMSLALVARAGDLPPSAAQAETGYLLALVEASSCEFYRNGTAYDGSRAGSHLRDKYALIVAADHVLTADAFVEKVATRSSMTGRPYEVSCAGHERVPLGPWLREALARYRTNGAPRESRDAR